MTHDSPGTPANMLHLKPMPQPQHNTQHTRHYNTMRCALFKCKCFVLRVFVSSCFMDLTSNEFVRPSADLPHTKHVHRWRRYGGSAWSAVLCTRALRFSPPCLSAFGFRLRLSLHPPPPQIPFEQKEPDYLLWTPSARVLLVRAHLLGAYCN
jgi:hypothetical protein